jgi:hypothetical protein
VFKRDCPATIEYDSVDWRGQVPELLGSDETDDYKEGTKTARVDKQYSDRLRASVNRLMAVERDAPPIGSVSTLPGSASSR